MSPESILANAHFYFLHLFQSADFYKSPGHKDNIPQTTRFTWAGIFCLEQCLAHSRRLINMEWTSGQMSTAVPYGHFCRETTLRHQPDKNNTQRKHAPTRGVSLWTNTTASCRHPTPRSSLPTYKEERPTCWNLTTYKCQSLTHSDSREVTCHCSPAIFDNAITSSIRHYYEKALCVFFFPQ